MANRKNEDGIDPFVKAVQRQITRLATRNNQSAQPMLGGTANQRVASRQFDGLGDQVNCFRRCRGIDGDQEIGQPRQIDKRSFRIAQPRQERAFGLAGLVSAMRPIK